MNLSKKKQAAKIDSIINDIELISEKELQKIKQTRKEIGGVHNMAIGAIILDAIILLKERKDNLTKEDYESLKRIAGHSEHISDSDSITITKLRKRYLSES